jgi:hypothetical protein
MTYTQLSYACNFKCITKNNYKPNINLKYEHGIPATWKYLSMQGYFRAMVLRAVLCERNRSLYSLTTYYTRLLPMQTWKIRGENYFIYLQSITRSIWDFILGKRWFVRQCFAERQCRWQIIIIQLWLCSTKSSQTKETHDCNFMLEDGLKTTW